MLNEELYEELEHELTKADMGITGRELSVKEQAGHAKLVAY